MLRYLILFFTLAAVNSVQALPWQSDDPKQNLMVPTVKMNTTALGSYTYATASGIGTANVYDNDLLCGNVLGNDIYQKSIPNYGDHLQDNIYWPIGNSPYKNVTSVYNYNYNYSKPYERSQEPLLDRGHMSSDGFGGYNLPNGDYMRPDGFGGYNTRRGKITSDGFGGYNLPNGDYVRPDGFGGYNTRNGKITSDGFGGYRLPDGKYMTPDGFGGYYIR